MSVADVTIAVKSGELLTVEVPGLQGATGPPGPQGPMGPAYGYVHVQTTASSTWVVAHNLGKRVWPTLTLASAPGEPVYTDVEFVDDNTWIITWPTPVIGRAEI